MRHRRRAFARAVLALSAAATLGGAASGADVRVAVTGLRSEKGQVLACLTTRADTFPNCEKDPAARKLTVPAAKEVALDFGTVPPGRYAVSVIHDENANGKLDTSLIIPREGYGFSNDAPVRMGPPKFASAAFDVGDTPLRLTIRMRYLL